MSTGEFHVKDRPDAIIITDGNDKVHKGSYKIHCYTNEAFCACEKEIIFPDWWSDELKQSILDARRKYRGS